MSNRHTTLQDYLGNRLSPPKKHAQRPLHINNQQYMEVGTAANRKFFATIQRTVEPNIESWKTSFHESRRECQQQLQRLLENISNEQHNLVKYLQQYQKQVQVEMEQQFIRIKQQLIALIDRGFQQNKKKIKDGFHLQGAREMADLERIRQRLANMKKQIEECQRNLECIDRNNTGATYKKSIASIVTTDFQSEGYALMEQVAAILMQYEDKVYLRVDGTRFSRIRDDIASLIDYADSGDGPVYLAGPHGMINRMQPTLVGAHLVPTLIPDGHASLRPSAAFGNSLSPPTGPALMTSVAQSVRQNNLGSLPPTLMNPNLHRNRDLLQSSSPE